MGVPGVGVLVGVCVKLVGVKVLVGLGVCVFVGVNVCVGVGVSVAVLVAVDVGVSVGVLVTVDVGVSVGVFVTVDVGVSVGRTTATQVENCEVSLVVPFVAVPVTGEPSVAVGEKVKSKLAVPPPFVVASPVPINVSPSPVPEPSHAVFEKKSRWYNWLAAPVMVPVTRVLP